VKQCGRDCGPVCGLHGCLCSCDDPCTVSVPIGQSISMAPSLLFAHNLLQVSSNSVCSCCLQYQVLCDVLINEGMG
jgi:hypothetical protein